jgi:hypothetical protein
MKKLIFALLTVCCSLIINAQDYMYLGASYFNFDDSTKYNHIYIDSTEIWNIVKPDKEILFLPDQPHYFGEYGIITDTSQYYTPNIDAYFQFKLIPLLGVNVYSIEFWHKYDFNPNIDGGIIETSWDYGSSWQNILFDNIIQSNLWDGNGQNMYQLTDTIATFDNQPGFTGLNSEGKHVVIYFYVPMEIYNEELDTLLVRFSMKSSEVESNHEGWLIDNFSSSSVIIDNIEEIQTNQKLLNISPNPTNDLLNITLKNEKIYHIAIYTLTGRFVKEFVDTNSISVSGLSTGIYLLRVNGKYSEKLIVK